MLYLFCSILYINIKEGKGLLKKTKIVENAAIFLHMYLYVQINFRPHVGGPSVKVPPTQPFSCTPPTQNPNYRRNST